MKPIYLATFCVLLTITALAQSERGTITGTVSDQANAIIPRATVRATNIETGVQYQSITTQTGDYTISQIPAGSYSLSMEAPGFNRFVQQGIRIYVAQTARIDVVLQVGGASESVTVTAQAPLLRTENAEQSSSITRETLNDLPLNFGQRGNVGSANVRNPYTFVTLVPGGNIMSYSSIKLNGAPLDSDSIRVEGQDSNNSRLMYRQDQVQPSVEALEEISVQTSNFAPEYGQVSGGMFNLVAKSGTNQFHGSAFEYFVNEDLAAGLPFTNSGNGHLLRPKNRRHDFGGSIGGPVWIPKLYNGHNRTFFFFAYEKFHQNQNQAGLLQTLPTDAMRNGDFSGALTGKALGTDPAGRSIPENTIYDPRTNSFVNGQTIRDPFPGNVIPLSRMDPVALKIQALIPHATRAGVFNNWDQSYLSYTDEIIPSIKVDEYLGSKGKVSFYYSKYFGPHFNGPDGLPVPLTQNRYLPTTTHTARLNYDLTVTPTFLIHGGVGFMRHVNCDMSVAGVLSFDALTQLGLKGGLPSSGAPAGCLTPDIHPSQTTGMARITGLLSSTGGGLFEPIGISTFNPVLLNKPTAVLSGALVRGSHSLKVGGEWRIDAFTNGVGSSAPGIYNFSNAETGLPYTQGQSLSGGNVGLPYASFLLGAVDSASIANPTAPQGRKHSWALYAQDSWKVTRKLSVEYGVRWDYQGFAREIHDRVSMFAPWVPNPSAGGLLGATLYQGYGAGRCNCIFASSYPYAVAPRLGIAYQIAPKTVLRAGWGITYGQTEVGQADFGGQLGVGGWNTLSFSTATYGQPALQLSDGLNYNLSTLYAVASDPGIRPSPGQLNAPPALIDPNAGRPPRMNQWNIALQREITHDLIVEAAYVGNRGVWFVASSLVDWNALTPQRLLSYGLDVNDAAARTLLTSPIGSTPAQTFLNGVSLGPGANSSAPWAVTSAGKLPYAGYPTGTTLAQALRPYPQFGTLSVSEAPLGNSWYDALQVKLTKRYSHGLDLTSTFAWQKELADMGQGYGSGLGQVTGNVNDVFNRRNQKSLSSLSEPFAFSVGFSYQLPALGGSRWARAAIGGWTFGGIMRYSSGLPIPVPIAQNNLSALLFRPTFFNRNPGVPLFTKDINCHCVDPNKDLVLNPAAWSNPAAGQWGTASAYYDDFRYQRRPNEQLSLGRIFRIREGMSFQIRAEFFNPFNRTYMNDPVASNPLVTPTHNSSGALTSGFGYINAGSLNSQPRNGQIVARFQF
jgi:hypothetical protein